MDKNTFLSLGEYAAAGLYEEPERSLFYRKSLGLRRYFENCELPEYKGKPLYPSGSFSQRMNIVPDYMQGLSFRSGRFESKAPELAAQMRKEFDIYRSQVPTEHTVAGDMWTHSMPNYERILEEGLLSYVPRIEKIEDRDIRGGLLHLVNGIIRYVERCGEYLKSVGADSSVIDAITRVPLYPARNIYEAIFAWNFILYLDGCDNLGSLAKGILPYYRGENIIPLLENLYDNLDDNDGYSMSLDSECPELTVQCLKAVEGKRRPMIELLVDEQTPEAVWDAAVHAVKSGGGQPAFYNKAAFLGGLKSRFPDIKDADLSHFCGGGCTESMLAGYSCVGSVDAGINLLLILEGVLQNHLLSVGSFDELYSIYIEEVRTVTEEIKKAISASRLERAKYNPLPMRTLLVDDCIDKGQDFNAGGTRYGWSIISFAGLINALDSLLALKELVFDKKKYTPSEVLEFLKNNDGAFLSEAKGVTLSHGKDIEEVNDFARKFSSTVFKMTEGGELAFGEGFISASILFKAQNDGGRNVGATPDGRHASEPIADSLAAIFGKDKYGPTALLNSVTALDLKSALGTPVVNFNLTQKFDDHILTALIKGYIKRGGMQLQISCVDKDTLIDAYEHPENHGNLIVRVGGFSEYFNRLQPSLKRMIIDRTIQNS